MDFETELVEFARRAVLGISPDRDAFALFTPPAGRLERVRRRT